MRKPESDPPQSLLRNILLLSWPTVVYTIMETLVGLVDIYFATYIDNAAVASLGFSRQIFLVLMIGTIAITTGTITLVSQHYGAGRYQSAGAVALHSILLACGAGLLLGAIGAVLAPVFLFALGAQPDVLNHGVPYLRILLGGVVFLMINFSTNGIFRALGDAKTPLKIALLVNLLNVLFDYLFLFGIGPFPAMGVKGIAVGTLLARAIGGGIAIWLLCQKTRLVHIDWKHGVHQEIFREILRIGLPSGFSGFLRNGARIVFIGILASTTFTTLAVSAAAIGFQIRLFAIMPSLAFQVATAALVGQSIGAGRIDRAEAYAWTSVKFCSSLMALVSMPLLLFPQAIMALFTQDPEVTRLGIISLRWIALEQFCNSVSIVASGCLAGAGDTRPSMQIGRAHV